MLTQIKKCLLGLKCLQYVQSCIFFLTINAEIIVALIQFSMLKVFSTSQGIDIFSKSSSNYLIHEWSRAPNLSSFSYRMASRDVHGEPSITVSTKFIHVSFVNSKKELCHLQINRNSPNESKHRVLAQSVNQHISLSSCCSGNEIYIYFIKTDGKLIESKLKAGDDKGDQKKVIDDGKFNKSMLKAIETQNGEALIIYKKMESICWMSLKGGNRVVQNNLQIPFPYNQNQKYQAIDINGKIHFFFVSKIGDIHELILDPQMSIFVSSKRIDNLQVLPYVPLSLTTEANMINIWFASGKSRISCYSKQKQSLEWNVRSFDFEHKMGKNMGFSTVNQNIHVFMLDNKQIVSKYKMNCTDAKAQFLQIEELPYLTWEQIQKKSKGIGRGYWTDVFYNDQLKKAIKKFRNSDHANKVHEEIKNLQKMESIEPNMVFHRIFEKGVLKGFTIPFMKARPWHQILKNQHSIIHRSPIARVKLVIALAEHIRAIQQVNLCHGDIHIGNVMLNVEQNKNVQDPTVWAKVIDFGNAFEMEEDKLVSVKWLTGARNLIPPQIRARNENNYNPYSYNPYQLAVNALMFLLRQNFHGEFHPQKKIEQLRRHRQYPLEIHKWLADLISSDKKRQSEALNRDIRHFQEETRAIYFTNLARDPNNNVLIEGQRPNVSCGCQIM